MDVYTKCSNYATDTCPCVLAERGQCVECSMCRGEDFCTCTDTVSFCIQQELINHGGRAKPQRQSMRCEVTYVKEMDDVFRFIRIRVPDPEAFIHLGAYVFVRRDENPFFDVPISVLYEDYSSGTIGFFIQMVGIKTECFRSIEKGDHIYVRGPYFSGMQGRGAVGHLRDGRAAVVCRGIGFMPSLHVIGALWRNHNEVDVYLDWGKSGGELLEFFKNLQEIHVTEVSLCDGKGELTEDFDRVVAKAEADGVGLIHLGLSDYLLKQAIGRIEETDPHHRKAISCINNSHICCGEGICGACTKDLGADHTVHLCKEQLDLYEYGRLL